MYLKLTLTSYGHWNKPRKNFYTDDSADTVAVKDICNLSNDDSDDNDEVHIRND